MSFTLYSIKEQFLKLADMDLDEQTLKDTLESLEFDLEEKIDNISSLIKSLEAEETALKNEVDNLLTRAKSKAKKACDLKEYLFNTLKQLDRSKFETTRNVLIIKKNPVSVILDDDFQKYSSYEKYCITEIISKPDKTRIKEDLKKGIEIKGARLEQKERLEIK